MQRLVVGSRPIDGFADVLSAVDYAGSRVRSSLSRLCSGDELSGM